MSYLGAADSASKAAKAAHSAKINHTEYRDRKLAESVELLAKAVQELAEEMHRES